MRRAALYLRSSKDRNDVSIDAQRRELKALADARDIVVVAEFVDVVESGKDTDRPGFQSLLRAMRVPGRQWDTLLLLDTSRLSRRRHISVIFEEVEARRAGVQLVYKSLPETDPITDMLLKSVLQAMDEWHSLTSKRKGLAGMAENVRQGYRAGGRAPYGYRLERIETGAVRDGMPVRKSRLVPDDRAPAIARYLAGRAKGLSRTVLASKLGIRMTPSSLVGIEWNALTYAGATVWNVHNERTGGGYRGKTKRRPRGEWVIQHATHEALITLEQAEAIINALEHSTKSASRRTTATYLLTGLLVTPDGTPWHGDAGGRYYRVGKGQRVAAETIERGVLAKIASDFRSDAFIGQLTRAHRSRTFTTERAEIQALREQIGGIDSKIARYRAVIPEMQFPRSILEQIDRLEADRRRVEQEIGRLSADLRDAQQIVDISDASIRRVLSELADELGAIEREPLKDLLRSMIGRVEFDPAALTCRIFYEIPLERGDRLASPRRFQSIPRAKTVGYTKVA